MADVVTVNSIKEYFKKLQRVVLQESDFSFLGKSYIKKNKIDDILCCILATLPDIYKKNLRNEDGKKLKSMVAYNILFAAVKGKCWLNSNVYSVDKQKANSVINTIISHIERDINYLEKRSQ